MFCPKCGSILKPKKKQGKNVLVCSCGYGAKDSASLQIRETMQKAPQIEVAQKESYVSLPKTDAECPKCQNKEAYYWLLQTRAGDEPETKFLRCTKCNYTWREYD